MYDWPEVAGTLDEWWGAASALLHADGIDAPAQIDRSVPLEEGWAHRDLFVGQTCGLPMWEWVREHADAVALLDFGIPHCPPGHYRSVVVARRGDERSLHDHREGVVAFNQRHSQSGFGSMVDLVSSRNGGQPFFSREVETGAHRSSVRVVAEGAADVAAIDEQSWRLAVDHEPAAEELKIIGVTRSSPGTPIIVGHSAREHTGAVVGALRAALDRLAEHHRRALHVRGLVSASTADFEMIPRRIAAASPPVLVP